MGDRAQNGGGRFAERTEDDTAIHLRDAPSPVRGVRSWSCGPAPSRGRRQIGRLSGAGTINLGPSSGLRWNMQCDLKDTREAPDTLDYLLASHVW